MNELLIAGLPYIVGVVVAYLLGAIPFGLLIAHARGVDLRSQGSGNIGATNVFRCVGKGWGALTFVLDMLKGFLSAYCIPLISAGLGYTLMDGTALFFGIAAFVGHCWPVYAGFKGGKGISTALGMLIGVAPGGAGVAAVVWLITFLLGRWVSLASVFAAAAVAISMIPLYGDKPIWFQVFLFALVLAAIGKHRSNIVRLIHREEHRFCFTQKQRNCAMERTQK